MQKAPPGHRRNEGDELCQDLTEQALAEWAQEQEEAEVFAIPCGQVQALSESGRGPPGPPHRWHRHPTPPMVQTGVPLTTERCLHRGQHPMLLR